MAHTRGGNFYVLSVTSSMTVFTTIFLWCINVSNFDAGFLFREEAIKGIVQPSLVNDPNKTRRASSRSARVVVRRTVIPTRDET